MLDTALPLSFERLSPETLALLDAPVRAAFAHRWAQFCHRKGMAACLKEDIGIFADAPFEGSGALADLIRGRSAPVAMVQAAPIQLDDNLKIETRLTGVQMVLQDPVLDARMTRFSKLGPADAPDMLTLARLTKPGPFEIRTHLLGDFIGLRNSGKLIAMVGQRMTLPGWVEISAVAVHPEHRGHGLARSLVTAMMRQIALQGKGVFLHSYADNLPAITLYESLGFALRREMNIAMVTANEVSQFQGAV